MDKTIMHLKSRLSYPRLSITMGALCVACAIGLLSVTPAFGQGVAGLPFAENFSTVTLKGVTTAD